MVGAQLQYTYSISVVLSKELKISGKAKVLSKWGSQYIKVVFHILKKMAIGQK